LRTRSAGFPIGAGCPGWSDGTRLTGGTGITGVTLRTRRTGRANGAGTPGVALVAFRSDGSGRPGGADNIREESVVDAPGIIERGDSPGDADPVFVQVFVGEGDCTFATVYGGDLRDRTTLTITTNDGGLVRQLVNAHQNASTL
jgi:hypothetical protein